MSNPSSPYPLPQSYLEHSPRRSPVDRTPRKPRYGVRQAVAGAAIVSVGVVGAWKLLDFAKDRSPNRTTVNEQPTRSESVSDKTDILPTHVVMPGERLYRIIADECDTKHHDVRDIAKAIATVSGISMNRIQPGEVLYMVNCDPIKPTPAQQ